MSRPGSRSAPQPIPYQGSKRALASQILSYLPADTGTLYDGFCGSGALSIAAAGSGRARRYLLSDTLGPLVGLWRLILDEPETLIDEYQALWTAQIADPRSFYLHTREQYNLSPSPARLLYLLARCVKSAVRFNADGAFNQSADHRRLGARPAVMAGRIRAVHRLMAGKTEAVVADYNVALQSAGPRDVVYLDPPYLGVSGGRDGRYHQGLDLERFIADLDAANSRGVSMIISLDGRTGDRRYGEDLPQLLKMRKLEIVTGRSSQSTLSGRSEETVESLYLSPAVWDRLPNSTRSPRPR